MVQDYNYQGLTWLRWLPHALSKQKLIHCNTCMLTGGLIYLAGGEEQLRNGSDVFHKFRPQSDFAYVTGVTEPGFACVLDPESGAHSIVALHHAVNTPYQSTLSLRSGLQHAVVQQCSAAH